MTARFRSINSDLDFRDLDSIPVPEIRSPDAHVRHRDNIEKAVDARRAKSTNGNTIAPGDVAALRTQIASAKMQLRDMATEFDKAEDTLRSITAVEPHPDDVDEHGITTAAALEQSGAAEYAVVIARLVKEQLVAEGIIPRNGVALRKGGSVERPDAALAKWMIGENTRQAMTRWYGLMIDGTAQAFRLFRKHMPKGKPGEKAVWLTRNLNGEAWRFVKVDRDPPFGPGRPMKLVHNGTVTLTGPGGEGARWLWKETPNARTMLGILHNEEKDLRYALVRDPALDIPADEMVPAEIRGAV